MPEPDPYFANLQRGTLLLNQGRPKDALPYFQAAIAANPDAPYGYAELARCYNEIPAQRSKCIGAINRAIALAPQNSHFHGLKGWFLICLANHQGAYKAAQQGLAINPTCYQSLNALANAHTKLGQWKKAEAACLRILALNPHDAPGLNLLAQALRHLGRWKDAREAVARLLANTPNNAFGHANAGYGALAAGDHLRANEHFLESLRLNPHFDLARRGLLESLRARIWIVRVNMRFSSYARRPLTPRGKLIFFLGAVAIFAAIAGFAWGLDALHANLGTLFCGFLLMALLLFFLVLGVYIYLSVVAALMGNFLLLFDPLGRHALTRQEKMKACLPTFMFALVIGALFVGNAAPFAYALIGLLVILAATIQFPLLKDRWQRHREKGREKLTE